MNPIVATLEAARLTVSPSFADVVPNATFLNITAPGVDKGSALTYIADSRGYTTEEIVTIGDGPNDVPLFANAGTAIAMGGRRRASEIVRT